MCEHGVRVLNVALELGQEGGERPTAAILEKAGTGIRRMREGALAHGCMEPAFDGGSFSTATFWPLPREDGVVGERPESRPESETESLKQRALLMHRGRPLSKSELASCLGQKQISGQPKKVLLALAAEERIEFTVPDKPNSRLQKYRLATKVRDQG